MFPVLTVAPPYLGTDEIKWNFTKFLIDRDGNVVRRYEPTVTPRRDPYRPGPAAHQLNRARGERAATAHTPPTRHTLPGGRIPQPGVPEARIMSTEALRQLFRQPEALRQPEAHGHQHRDVSGGWLRPAVFGAMDGLVTNASLIAGVGGGGGAAHTVVLTGLAGLVAGAMSMAAGEFVSVSSQNELVSAEVHKERLELETNADAERAEMASMLRAKGVSADVARMAAAQISENPEKALAVHTLGELGVNPGELPSPVTAAGASLVSFAAGAIVPLIPYLAGYAVLGIALACTAVAAIAGGGVVARVTSRPFLRGAFRQLLLVALATGVTYGVGALIGAAAS
jgi:vacuolar iron transporter family protein